MKITQEVADKLQEYLDSLPKPEFGFDDRYVHFFDEKENKDKYPWCQPWVTINFGSGSLNAEHVFKIKEMFPEAVIYISGRDGETDVSLHDITHEEADRLQMEYNHRQEAQAQ